MLFVLLFDHLLLPLFQCYVAVNMLLYFFFSNGYGNLGPRLGYGRIGRPVELTICVIKETVLLYCIIPRIVLYIQVCILMFAYGGKKIIYFTIIAHSIQMTLHHLSSTHKKMKRDKL